ncbi:hypothetical protein KIPE111705_39750 [Kibdelosporangium persicum]|uniref:hypothetical protein n=1 Tax=Kibdelosporangium persicum TaxID=2698649 RepID=UPI0015656965|nr:hypothetical protein [Kibdelosporangium persicum]
MTDYTTVADLSAVYLEDSYVLQIVEEPGTVRFRLEAVLTPEHPVYRPPKPGEQYCYATGWLIFSEVGKIEWARRSAARFTDATGEVDLGNVDYMKREAEGWALGGDWGDVVIATRADPRFLLDDSAQGA